MKYRRCSVLFVELREVASFDIYDLCKGGAGVARRQQWVALAPHLQQEIEVSIDEMSALGLASPDYGLSAEELGSLELVAGLFKKGLLLSEAVVEVGTSAYEELNFRKLDWHPLAATFSIFTRWSGVDSANAAKSVGETASALEDAFGEPPPIQVRRSAKECLPLGRGMQDELGRLLRRRVTCRNFDLSQPLSFVQFSEVVEKALSAHDILVATEKTSYLKRGAPSGGGLHPIDAYLCIRQVEGVPDGIYHYLPIEHALEMMDDDCEPLDEFLNRGLAGQDWFSTAHVVIVLSARYARNFWKYKAHPKALRALFLEAGHFSQNIYLAATAASLGAYVTCAVNEIDMEKRLEMDGVSEGVLAVCGFGHRANTMEVLELDPCGEIWSPSATSVTPQR